MTTVTRPRGPLPARVYWTRRLLVVVVAFALVFGIARLLGGAAVPAGPSAQPVGADASTSAPRPRPPGRRDPPRPRHGRAPGKAKGKAGTAHAADPARGPDRALRGSDVVATPSVKGTAYAGRPVVFTMPLDHQVSPACTWDVSARVDGGQGDLAAATGSGPRQDCRGAVPKQSVVVRKDQPATVAGGLERPALRHDCTRSTAWAEPGFYHVLAASFGADPSTCSSSSSRRCRATITATPKPKNPRSPPSHVEQPDEEVATPLTVGRPDASAQT